MYYKRCTGAILAQKSTDFPDWVQWMHHSEGKTHCEECLMLDGCWFAGDTHPPCPHHPFCHCILEQLTTHLFWQIQQRTAIIANLIPIYLILKIFISTERIRRLSVGDMLSLTQSG